MSRSFKTFGAFIVLFALAIVSQAHFGVFDVAPGAHGDEPSHIVTGLMVRDWIASGFPLPAMNFAENYYLHYPRVALGHWPPVFYGVQAVWTLIAPPTSASLFVLMAALTALLCLRAGQAAHAYAPGWMGAAVSLVLLATPPVVIYSGTVMAEILLCWLCLEAVLAFAAWMEAPGWRQAAWFALWAGAACLTKVTAVWLAPMVALAVLLSARPRFLLMQPSLWVAGALVAGSALPWYLLAPGALHQASPDQLGVIDAAAGAGAVLGSGRAMSLIGLLAILVGWLGPLLGAAVWGAAKLWRDGRAIGIVTTAAVAGMALMRYAVSATAYEERTVMPLLAPLLVCAAGAAPVFRRWPVAGFTAVAGFALAGWLAIPAKPSQPVMAAARVCLRPDYSDAVVLVAAGSLREGAFVASIALHDTPARLTHFVLRSSKLMARSTWNGSRYEALVQTPAETWRLLEQVPVGLVAIDTDPRQWRRAPHTRVLAETIAALPDRFRLVHAGPLRVYEVAGYRTRPRGEVSLFMYGLGRSIGISGAR